MKTLLIDDDPFALKLLARQLERIGYLEVVQCLLATDALAQLQAQPDAIDLVFCDLQMPGVDGVEFVRHLADLNYRGGLVLVSGEQGRIVQTVQRLAQAHKINLLGALAKPVSFVQLQALLAGRAARGTSAAPSASVSFSPAEIQRALECGELVNHYQPQVSLSSGALIGVEALVRWRHPQAGLVYPDRFISAAEEHGLIDDLTSVVLTAALVQSRQWRDAGLELVMAVNVSMDNLAALNFPDRVERLASDAGVPLTSLVLEVTESRLMKDLRAPLDILTRLRLKRISLSIDDFGTGYSSLAQLRDIPFDELKLDRGFIDGVTNDGALRAIVEGTLAMARQLDMRTVAEGIERREDWDCLRALGCDVAQGYFIARPMPGDQLVAWAANWALRRHEMTAQPPAP